MVYRVRATVVALSSPEYAWTPKSWLHFVVDILVILPLPQVLVFYVIPKLNDPRVSNATALLSFIFTIQYVLRVARTYSLLKKAIRACCIQLKLSTWANLSFLMLAGHVLGAFWYLFSIERKATCWMEACKHLGVNCSLYCDDTLRSGTLLNDSCSTNSTLFYFGIYSDALESGVVDSTHFLQRISYGFWWGLQNLSSLGQSLKTSTHIWEICFAVSVSICGLVLFAFLIGNMQTHLLSKEEMRAKQQEIAEWMSSHSLPRNLETRIWQSGKCKLKENTGIHAETFLHLLPHDLSKDIKRHICYNPLRKVPLLRNKNEELLDTICEHLKPVLYKKNSIIFQEGEPLAEMLFITRGNIVTYTTPAIVRFLTNGDCYGEELLDWILHSYGQNNWELMSTNISNFPLSTKTVKAQTEVEVFVLRVQQLKLIVKDFWLHFNTEIDLKPWAAYSIQTAWRRRRAYRSTCLRGPS